MDVLSAWPKTLRLPWFCCRMVRRHPIGVFANEKGDGSNAGGNDAAFSIGRIVQSCRMRRQTSPANGSSKAELIEPSRIVIHDARRKNVPLPGVRRDLEALQLAQNFQSGALTLQVYPWGD